LLTRLVRQVGELSGSDFATPHRPARAKDLSHPTDTRPGAPGPETPQTPLPVEVLVQSAIVLHGPSVEDGALIQSVTVAWFEIIKQLDRDPHILSKIPPRKVEELIAGAYERAGWPEVILTPRSGDHGRDIIATKPGIGSIRIFDQIKAYSPGHVVTADEVRSMLGVLYAEKNVSKGVITTSSSFAPNLRKDTGLSAFLPHRLELKDGPELRRWLLDLLGQTSANE
jgi:restriction system protein